MWSLYDSTIDNLIPRSFKSQSELHTNAFFVLNMKYSVTKVCKKYKQKNEQMPEMFYKNIINQKMIHDCLAVLKSKLHDFFRY